MTALTRNASQAFSTDIHVTFTSPVHIRETTGTASQTVQVFFFAMIRVQLQDFISRQRMAFFFVCVPKTKYLERKHKNGM